MVLRCRLLHIFISLLKSRIHGKRALEDMWLILEVILLLGKILAGGGEVRARLTKIRPNEVSCLKK